MLHVGQSLGHTPRLLPPPWPLDALHIVRDGGVAIFFLDPVQGLVERLQLVPDWVSQTLVLRVLQSPLEL